MTAVTDVVVAVPARDEEVAIASCLAAVLHAVERLRWSRPAVRVSVVVALDHCSDGTADVVAAFPVGVTTLEAGCVGAARAAAVEHGLDLAGAGGAEPSSTWVAVTDADSVVPPHWLESQVGLADAGVDLVVGTVEPAGPIDPALLAAWRARHELREGHEHVHGANLGIRAGAYRAVGGFPAWPLHEDVALVTALRRAGHPWLATDAHRVLTSARRLGRLSGGFADYLTALAGTPQGGPTLVGPPCAGTGEVSRPA